MEETNYTKRMKENFPFFGPVTFAYAVFYAFCMFRNGAGVTFPFFMAGSLLYLCFALSKLGISFKKGSGFYMAGAMLLSVSTFCTDDWRIIILNKLGILLLMASLLLQQFFDTSGWKMGKYLWAFCRLFFGSLGEFRQPFADASAYLKSMKNDGKVRNAKIWYVLLGMALSLPFLFITWRLLASADAVFRAWSESLLGGFQMENVIGIALRICFLYFATYLLTAYLCRRKIKEEVADRRTGEPILAITVTGMLSVLYLAFSVIQIVYLFLGRMQLPEGYTYAAYAREGFFQLLAVSALNLLIVLLALSFFRESRVLKAVLTVMSLCTFVMIASSALRMIIYIQYYYLTFLRILVLWGLALLFCLFVGVIVGIFKEKFPLFGYSAAVVTVLYLALSFCHPDYLIARINVANALRGGEQEAMNACQSTLITMNACQSTLIMGAEDGFFRSEPYHDYAYLSGLCADAAPVLVPYLKELGYDMDVIYKEGAGQASSDKGTGQHDSDIVYGQNTGNDNAAETADSAFAGANSALAGADGNSTPDAARKTAQDRFAREYLSKLRTAARNLSWRTFNISRHMALRQLED